MGRWREKRPRLDVPPNATLDGPAIDRLAASQRRGEAYYGEFLHPPAERTRPQYTMPMMYALWQLEPGRVVEPPDPALFQPQPRRPSEQQQQQQAGAAAAGPSAGAQPAAAEPSAAAPAATAATAAPTATAAAAAPTAAAAPGPSEALKRLIGEWKPPVFSEDGFMEVESELIQDAKQLGRGWQDIAALLPGRNVTSVRKHYTALMNKKKQEKQALLAAAAERANVGAGGSQGNGIRATTAVATRAADGRFVSDSSHLMDPVRVDPRCPNMCGGDRRVKLRKALPRPPKSNTVYRGHKLKSMEGVTFFEEVDVVDPDDKGKVYRFSVTDETHAACFNIGEGPDGSPLISWSQLISLYQLPDGTKWAEHRNLHDAEDLEHMAAAAGKPYKHLIPSDTSKQELFLRKGRFHSRLQNIEYECWVFRGSLEGVVDGDADAGDVYYWRTMFDADTLQPVKC